MRHSLVDWAVLNLFSPLYWEYKMTYSTVTKTETHYMIKQNRFAWRTGSERNSRMKDRGLSPSASKPSVEPLWPLRSCAEITKLTFGELICLILFSAGRWTQLFFLFFYFILTLSLIFFSCLPVWISTTFRVKGCVRGLGSLTRILLSFIWIFLETSSAQWGSLRKSQNIRPTAAFTQATVSSSCSPSPLGCTWAEVVLWNWGHSRQVNINIRRKEYESHITVKDSKTFNSYTPIYSTPLSWAVHSQKVNYNSYYKYIV